jgi:hypothetical protein
MENYRIQINGVWYVREDQAQENPIELEPFKFEGVVVENKQFCFEATRTLRDSNDPYDDINIKFTDKRIKPWKEDLVKNANLLLRKKIDDKKKTEQAKKEEEERKQKIGGGGSWVGFEAIQEHPALGTNEVITTSEGDASVYSLITGNDFIDKYLYGILVRKDNGTVEPVKFLTTDKKTPYKIDIENEQWIKWGFSKDNVWKYNDVIVRSNYEYITEKVKIYNSSCGDLFQLEDRSIQTIITSPPYFHIS